MRRKRVRVTNDKTHHIRSMTPDPALGPCKIGDKGDKTDTKFKVFIEPLTPKKVLKKYKKYLSKEDQLDITEYQNIYFVKKALHPIPSKFDISSLFPFQRNGHIAYRYQQIEIIGVGTFGIVINCFDHKTREKYAVKMIKNTIKDLPQIGFEKEFLEILTSDFENCKAHHVLPLQGYFIFRGYSCFVSDLCPTNLYDFIHSPLYLTLSTHQIKSYAKQIITAVAFVHEHKIVHSDLKPTNVLFNNNALYLIDFGSSCYDDRPLYRTVQSLFYRAPEVIFGFRYGAAIDIWSLGCLLYEMGTGSPLFPATCEEMLVKNQLQLLGEPPQEMVRACPLMRDIFPGGVVDRAKANERKENILKEQLKKLPGLAEVVAACLEWLPARRAAADDLLKMNFFVE